MPTKELPPPKWNMFVFDWNSGWQIYDRRFKRFESLHSEFEAQQRKEFIGRIKLMLSDGIKIINEFLDSGKIAPMVRYHTQKQLDEMTCRYEE